MGFRIFQRCFWGSVRFRKCCNISTLLALLFLILLFAVCKSFYPKAVNVFYFIEAQPQSNIKQNENSIKWSKKTNEISSLKTILAWTTKSGNKNWIPNTLKHLKCQESRCKVTEDRSKFLESDVIILHAKDVDLEDLPIRDPENQSRKLWALLNHEPPPQTYKHIFSSLNYLVDWTISYRSDSTIFAPIYTLELHNKSNISYQPPKKKRKPATWLVSHCKTSSNREGFVSELKKNVQVQVYGKCGQKLRACPPKSDIPRCYSHLSSKFKFYLSMENSLCRDYLTEKVYLALQAGMIPVVFGGAEYEKWLPANSYVNALEFSDSRSLAKYLNVIDKNETLYRSFFKWKSKYSVVQRRYKWLCDVCSRLHSEQAVVDQRKTNQDRVDLLEWWYLNSNCKSWQNGTVIHIDI